MATQIVSDDPGALTSPAYFDGTDAGLTQNAGMFAWTGDLDETGYPAEEGAMGIVGPITGASGGNHPATAGGR